LIAEVFPDSDDEGDDEEPSPAPAGHYKWEKCDIEDVKAKQQVVEQRGTKLPTVEDTAPAYTGKFSGKIGQEGSVVESELPQSFKKEDTRPIDFLRLFFDEEIVQQFVDETNKYAAAEEEQMLTANPVDVEEFWRFLAVCVFMGVVRLPERALYWSNDPNYGQKYAKERISAKRFDAIMRCWHWEDMHGLNAAELKARKDADPFYKAGSFLDALAAFPRRVSSGSEASARGAPCRSSRSWWRQCACTSCPGWTASRCTASPPSCRRGRRSSARARHPRGAS
jgi:hypothetical protein